VEIIVRARKLYKRGNGSGIFPVYLGKLQLRSDIVAWFEYRRKKSANDSEKKRKKGGIHLESISQAHNSSLKVGVGTEL